MKKQIITPILFLLGVSAFNLLFWQEQLGINVVLFTGFLTILFSVLYAESFKSPAVILTVIGSWVAAITVAWHHSLMSQITYLLSTLVMTGMVHRPQLRFIGYGLILSLLSILETPLKWVRHIKAHNFQWGTRFNRSFYLARISIIPLLIVGLFYLLYAQASEQFAHISFQFWSWLGSWFQWNISVTQISFLLFSILVIGGLIWKSFNHLIPSRESEDKEQLRRLKKKGEIRFNFGLSDLRKEFQMAVLCLTSLNALLLMFNLTDLNYVWLTKAPETSSQLRAYVHEGTYVLIFSIMMAMGLLLFFFRKNLNFYPKNQLLKSLAYLWVGQNALLVMSVAIRNYRYIDSFGLAYKRIGVVIFLILVLYGLWSVLQKIRDKKHSYFLFHRNAWALYWVILLTSTVNWDVLITRYNLTQLTKNPIDARFLLEDVSDKNLFVLLEHKEQFLQSDSYPNVSLAFKEEWLEKKKLRILKKGEKYSWLSWNYADYRNRKYLGDVKNSQ